MPIKPIKYLLFIILKIDEHSFIVGHNVHFAHKINIFYKYFDDNLSLLVIISDIYLSI